MPGAAAGRRARARRRRAARQRAARGGGPARSAFMFMCRSARPGAATATSTPTPPTSSAAGPAGVLRRPGHRRDPAGQAGARAMPAAGATVFFGGGTPTLLPPGAAGRDPGARSTASSGSRRAREVTTEANPESVDERALAGLRAAGFTRISFGMQSAVPHVLAILDRVHTPGRPARAPRWARAAGFGQVSLDLIYGTPGESRRGLAAVAGGGAGRRARPHLRLRAHRRGRHQAGRADPARGARRAGRRRDGRPVPGRRRPAGRGRAALVRDLQLGGGRGGQCRHNLLYWTGGDWWGIGPGAHSHVGGTRWWNVRHPAALRGPAGGGRQPGSGPRGAHRRRARTERIMLLTRLAAGCPVPSCDRPGGPRAQAVADGLAEPAAWRRAGWCSPGAGRLLADAVIRGPDRLSRCLQRATGTAAARRGQADSVPRAGRAAAARRQVRQRDQPRRRDQRRDDAQRDRGSSRAPSMRAEDQPRTGRSSEPGQPTRSPPAPRGGSAQPASPAAPAARRQIADRRQKRRHGQRSRATGLPGGRARWRVVHADAAAASAAVADARRSAGAQVSPTASRAAGRVRYRRGRPRHRSR